MPEFIGELNESEVLSGIFNMIIGQRLITDRISAKNALVDLAKEEGSLYGDQILFYSGDVLFPTDWLGDAEAPNLLDISRPDSPEVQAIQMNVFKMVTTTVDYYLSKRAFMDERIFSDWTAYVVDQLGKTQRIYDKTTYNAFIGNVLGTGNAQNPTVAIAAAATYQTRVELVANALSNLIFDITDTTRSYNEYGQMTDFDESQLIVVWNSKYVSEFNKLGTPEIFNREGLVDKFAKHVIHKRFFGREVVESSDVGSGKIIGTTGAYDSTKGALRVNTAKSITVGGTLYELFAGDQVPNGAVINITGVTAGVLDLDEVYIEDDKVICKIFVKLPPFMSGLEIQSSFMNARSATENTYLIWGHNTLEQLYAYPCITLKETLAS